MTGTQPIAPGLAVCAANKVEPGPSPLRRLTKVEYDNTVTDLFGTGVVPADKRPGVNSFPSEERRLGFDNNANVLSVSPLLSEQYLLAAEWIAAAAVETGTGTCATGMTDEACLTSLFSGVVKRLYRRPILAEEIKILHEVYDVGRQQDYKTGVKLMLAAALQSPQFLYRLEVGQPPKAGDTYVSPTAHEMATRLSYLLWNSMPDGILLTLADNAAKANRALTTNEIAAQATRMLSQTSGMPPMVTPNPKAKAMVQRFHNHWLELEKVLEVEKDLKEFPLTVFPTAHKSLMREEVDRFLEEAFWNPDTAGTLTALLTGAFAYVEPTLYAHYGKGPGGLTGAGPVPAAMGVTLHQRVATDGLKRGGILTTGAVLITQANANQTSPVLRGKFVREQLLCQMLPPPPNDVVIEPPVLSKSLTTRERFSMHMTAAACKGCHQLMDPMGLGFENFDSIARYRDTENGKAVDNSGEIVGLTSGTFKGVVDLGKKLAASEQATECVARQWFRFGHGREEEIGFDECTIDALKRKFMTSGGKFRDLLVALTTTDAFLYRKVGGAP